MQVLLALINLRAPVLQRINMESSNKFNITWNYIISDKCVQQQQLQPTQLQNNKILIVKCLSKLQSEQIYTMLYNSIDWVLQCKVDCDFHFTL